MQKIIVLDFGGQYNQLIVRRVRECGVYCEIHPCNTPIDSFADDALRGVILTGGPQSVYDPHAKWCDPKVLALGVPVLGICYGQQWLVHTLGGHVGPMEAREYGATQTRFDAHPLFGSLAADGIVWMNHNDAVTQLPSGFTAIAHTVHCACAAIADDARKLYGVQFHPEVAHTQNGVEMLRHFVRDLCGCACDWKMENVVDSMIADIRRQVGTGKVLCALSGGVDSSVAAVLVHRAVGDQLTCVFVDHGLLRKDEGDQVMTTYAQKLGLNIHRVNAGPRFLQKLQGVTDPEQKRKIIGNEFISVFQQQAQDIGAVDFFVQGTIYPDVIESGMGQADVIKSHHNVGGLPEDIGFKGLVEPLRLLFKDEVRALGIALGIDPEMVWRQPFPGPGLAIRILGDITEDRLRIVRDSDAILRQEIASAGLQQDVWQYFTVFTPLRTVGVMGDSRTYDHVLAIRAVTSTDAMTVEAAELPWPVLKTIMNRIIGEVPGVNRVVYDITSKPPGTIEWE